MSTDKLILTIDIGSSSCKVGLFRQNGKFEKSVTIPVLMVRKENIGNVREYDPELWWKAVCDGIYKLFSTESVKPDSVGVIGITGQICTHIFMEPSGKLLLPAISWQDGRAEAEAFWLQTHLKEEELDSLIGAHIPPSAAWPIPRLLWLKKAYSNLLNTPFVLIQPKDFILYRLSGIIRTDILSLRGLVHPQTGKIDPVIANTVLGIPDINKHIPLLDNADTIAGEVTSKAAEETGLLKNTPVVLGSGDFHAALLGTGLVDDSFCFDITGTSEHIGIYRQASLKYDEDKRLGRYPSLLPDWDVIYGVTSGAGASIDWFTRTFLTWDGRSDIHSLIQNTLNQVKSSEKILYLPYLNGERAPIWNTNARGLFFGLSSAHTLSHMLHAVFEGVAFSLNFCLMLINGTLKKKRPMRITGTASGDPVWNQIKADIFQIPIITMNCIESTSLGAAILAATGAGYYSTITDAVNNMTMTDREYVPNQKKAEYYTEMLNIYISLYPALKEQFDHLAIIKEAL